ncbi:hypothetical protein EG329_004647 [Mollisiaceae sp. DMI_Dod_QoI]|nr:hypothetical protein EG329_004647 [Helotiales sp. DMI_Dod_QoI]
MASHQPEPPTICKLCNIEFPSFIAYHNHKVQSRRHICCEICSQDFNNDKAFKQHHDLMHSDEQDLRCPGCNKKFTRLGGLIGHIELKTCRDLPNLNIEAARKEKEQSNAMVKSAHNFNDFSRGGVSFGDEPHPLAKTPAPSPQGQPGQGTPHGPVFHGDDLIGEVDLTSAILNAPWGGDESKLLERVALATNQFPPLSTKIPNIMDAPMVTASAPNAWTSRKDLFPAASPSLASSPSVAAVVLQAQVVAQPDPEPDPFDPDSPGFDPQKYYIPLTQKYKCPYFGCGKSMNNRPAFIQHLKSTAHRIDKLQCTKCLRYYASATALTQHMESQGVRCKVRESVSYNTVVDEVTGGVALASGRHRDNTVKYVVNNGIIDAAGGVVAANKAAHDAKNGNFNNYWSKRQPKW